MKKLNLAKELTELAEIPSVTGHEELFTSLLEKNYIKLFEETRIDNLGNFIGLVKGHGKNRKRILFDAHMDQIGLMIDKIEDNGILRFTKIGGINLKAILGKRVRVYGKKPVFGVIGMKPPHLMEPQEHDSIGEIRNLFIDCGYNGSEMRKLVRPGDIAIMDFTSARLENECFTSSALDNKAGVQVLLEAARLICGRKPYHDVYFLFSSQEEVGHRGAKTGAYGIDPDIAVACDVTVADPACQNKIVLGKGPVLSCGPGHDKKLVEQLKTLAEQEDIPIQTKVEGKPAGTNAASIQILRKGIITTLISIPLKNMHSQVEIVSLKDIYRASRLMVALAMEENPLEKEDGHE